MSDKAVPVTLDFQSRQSESLLELTSTALSLPSVLFGGVIPIISVCLCMNTPVCVVNDLRS